jgi:hypothetical protein
MNPVFAGTSSLYGSRACRQSPMRFPKFIGLSLLTRGLPLFQIDGVLRDLIKGGNGFGVHFKSLLHNDQVCKFLAISRLKLPPHVRKSAPRQCSANLPRVSRRQRGLPEGLSALRHKSELPEHNGTQGMSDGVLDPESN